MVDYAYIARHICEIFGPCRVLHGDAPSCDLLSGLLLGGCDAWATGDNLPRHIRQLAVPETGLYDVVVIEAAHSPYDPQTPFVLHALAGLFNADGLVLCGSGGDREKWEGWLFENGWRRHPAAPGPDDIAMADSPLLPMVMVYQRVAAALAGLLPDPPDPLRSRGREADFTLERYLWAAERIRPGDFVMEIGCGWGSGCAVIAARSRGARYIGLTPIAAQAQYAAQSNRLANLTFGTGDFASIDKLAAHSLDVLIAFDLPNDTAIRGPLLQQMRRVLRPDGRLIAGMHCDGDPVAHYDALAATIMPLFVHDVSAVLTGYSPGQAGAPYGYWVLFSVNCWSLTQQAEKGEFYHPAFIDALQASSGNALIDFAAHYDDPWIYRTMIQIGERVSDENALSWLAENVAGTARYDSADRGAALVILGYRALEAQDPELAGHRLLGLVAYYGVSTVSDNPHVKRWGISAAFLAARLYEMVGMRDHAIQWFLITGDMDWRAFSPILATKTVAAWFYAGVLLLTQNRREEAVQAFKRGVTDSLAVAQSAPDGVMGNLDAPITFGLPELSDVIDIGGQCAIALANLDLWAANRGAFWRKIDVKRIGMLSWARSLERENTDLRAENNRLRRIVEQFTAQPPVAGA